MEITFSYLVEIIGYPLAIAIGVYILGYLVRYFLIGYLSSISSKTDTCLDDAAFIFIKSFNKIFLLLLGVVVAIQFTDFPKEVSSIAISIFILWFGIRLAVASSRVVSFLGKEYGSSVKDKSLASALPAALIIVKIGIWLIIAIFILSNLGFDVTALVAGLGIGGLAFAFAFQKILADLFSAFVIFFDKPFSVGDSIVLDGLSGTVEHIGIKTTRIRAFTGEEIIIPNEALAGAKLSNISHREQRKHTLTVPISYYAENIDKVAPIVEKIVKKFEDVDFSHIVLAEYGEHAIMFELVFYVLKPDFDTSIQKRHEILLDILAALEEGGIELGYPIDVDPNG